MMRLQYFLRTLLGVIFRHPVLGVTIIPVLEDGRFVLVKRQDDGKWSLPGGVVDWGETITTTVHREIGEETGLTVISIDRLGGIYSDPGRDPRLHSIAVSIVVTVTGIPHIRDAMELKEIKAFTREELPLGSLSHDHDRQLQNYFANIIGIE